MRIARELFPYSLLLLMGFSFSTFSESLSAQEVEGRPWGRLNPPDVTPPKKKESRSGYLGRYNPWQKGKSGEAKDKNEAPRYRKREDERAPPSAPRYGVNPWGAPYQQYSPYYPTAPGQQPGGYYSDQYQPRPGGVSPWEGGYGYPYYGDSWGGGYDGVQPDRGLLWSDMWQW